MLLGVVLALAGAALYAAHATRGWRTELGEARARSAATDSALVIAQATRDQVQLEVAAERTGRQRADSAARAASARAGASQRREQAAKDQLAQASTAADSLPHLVEALTAADSTISDQGLQLVQLARDTASQGRSIASLLRADSLAGVSIAQLTADRDVWREKAERKPLTEITGKWFLGLPKPGWHLTAGVSSCPVHSLCVTAGYGF